MNASGHLQSKSANASVHLRSDRLESAAHALGLTLSDGQQQALRDYVDLLARWNKTYNLTAVRDIDQMWIQHIFDCLAVVKPLAELLGEGGHPAADSGRPASSDAGLPQASRQVQSPAVAATIADFGSGAGLPGLLLAIVWPHARIDTYDAVAKKIAFQQQVIGRLKLTNAHAHHARVETLKPDPAPDLIICRAFTSLAEFVRLAGPACGNRTWLAAMKSRTAEAEIAELPAGWVVHRQYPLRVPELEADRQLVILRKNNN